MGRNGSIRKTLLACAVALAAAGCGPSSEDVTMTMVGAPGAGPDAAGVLVILRATKEGRTAVVGFGAAAGQVSGGHAFPPGTTAEGVAQYYRGLLANAGWKEGEDFSVEGPRLHLKGVSTAALAATAAPK